jgi:drug/metabolite transporter (DMT)-like permease
VLLVARGLVAVAQIGVLFKAVTSISLLEAMLFRETAPLWIPVFSSLFLGESMPRKIWPTLLCGFAGVALVLHPNVAMLNAGYLYGIAAGVLFAVQTMMTRRLNQQNEPQDRILLYIYLIGILGTLVPAAQTYSPPDFVTVERLVLAGLLLLGSTTFIVVAMGHAPAWLLAPLCYSAVIFSALLDWLVLDKVPGPESTTGIVLVVISGILTLRLAPHRNPVDNAEMAKEGSG